MKRQVHPRQASTPRTRRNNRPRRTQADLLITAAPVDHDRFWEQCEETATARIRSRYDW